MSNTLAIAAATAALRDLLEKKTGIASVTVKPLDTARKGAAGDQLNLFLYQTSISAAWRNQPMPHQSKAGETALPPLPLCLYYLVTAFGSGDDELLAQGVLGKAMSVLHDHPILGADEIRAATQATVPGSDLQEQIERVRIRPQPLALEEVSKLWAAFQTNYRLSAAYEASVIFIQSSHPTRTPLPVLTRNVDVYASLVPPYPMIEQIELPKGQITAQMGDQITLVGHHFTLDTGETAQVEVTVKFITHRLKEPIEVIVPVDQRTDTSITVTIPNQPNVFYPAGLYQVVGVVMPNGKSEESRETNRIPLMLAPSILQINKNDLPALAEPPNPPISIARNNLGEVIIQIKCSPQVLLEESDSAPPAEENPALKKLPLAQSAMLLLGNRSIAADEPVLQIAKGLNRADTLTFDVKNIAAGTYRLRLRIDGVDSLLIDRGDPAKPKFDESQQVTLT
jgi:hypothetical protein